MDGGEGGEPDADEEEDVGEETKRSLASRRERPSDAQLGIACRPSTRWAISPATRGLNMPHDPPWRARREASFGRQLSLSFPWTDDSVSASRGGRATSDPEQDRPNSDGSSRVSSSATGPPQQLNLQSGAGEERELEERLRFGAAIVRDLDATASGDRAAAERAAAAGRPGECGGREIATCASVSGRARTRSSGLETSHDCQRQLLVRDRVIE